MKGIESFVMEVISMFPKLRRQIAVIITTLLIIAFSAILTVAHDTGQPHIHDPMDDVCENCNAVDESARRSTDLSRAFSQACQITTRLSQSWS